MWHCGAIIAVTAWALKARRDGAPPRCAGDIRRARDAEVYLRSVCDGEPCSAEDLMDRVHDDCMRRAVTDDTLTRLGRLLKSVRDPHGAQAYALTLAVRAHGAVASDAAASQPD